MNLALELICIVSFLLSIPLLLVLRWKHPSHMPWWLVVSLAALFGWVLSLASQNFAHRAAYEELSRPDPLTGDAPFPLITFYDGPSSLRWTLGLSYLALCLIPYLVLSRRSPQTRV